MMMMEELPPADAPPTEDLALEAENLVPVLVESSWRVTAFGVLLLMLVTLVIVGVVLLTGYLIGWTGSEKGDHDGLAPALAPREYRVAAPLLSSPLSSLAVAEPSRSLDPAPYETICNKTINRDECLAMFRGCREADGLKQWTVKAMEAAQQAVNESYILAQSMKKNNRGNLALQQCIDVFGDALGNVSRSIFLVNTTNMSPGAADVQTLMSAAMTNCETCGEGIEDVGSFPGSERITGRQAKHVDTMLSIALTFVNHLSTTWTVERYQNRRLLHANGITPAQIDGSSQGSAHPGAHR